jgi:hypothetical protein
MKSILSNGHAAIVAALIPIALAGCATKELPTYEMQTTNASQSKEKEELSVSIEPITTSDESKTYFGTDLLKEDILAIFVETENKSTNGSRLIVPEDFSLGPRRSGEELIEEVDKIDGAGGEVALAGAATFAVIPIAGLPVMMAGFKMLSDASVVRHNFVDKALRTQTLSPGEKTEGFVYFQLPAEEPRSNDLVLDVVVSQMNEDAITQFEFDIDLNEVGQ